MGSTPAGDVNDKRRDGKDLAVAPLSLGADGNDPARAHCALNLLAAVEASNLPAWAKQALGEIVGTGVE